MFNSKLDLAYRFVNYTGEHIFLTGKAGTGKTTFLHDIKANGLKRMIVVAPTGVAAINAGGVTIHSFFQMPFGPIIPGTQRNLQVKSKSWDYAHRRFSKEKVRIIKSMDLLVIDEISMVRADLLDGIDEVLRKYRDRSKPFGGVQLLMIGDLEQLAPVVKDDEWELLRHHYENAFFFSSKALKKTRFTTLVLEHVYRQSDQKFIEMLNEVRNKSFDRQTISNLNSRYIPGFIKDEHEGYIILTTHNAQAQKINSDRLKILSSPSMTFYADITGDFPENSYPTNPELELKTGAQVMFVKNDLAKEKRYFNGKIGIIEEIEEDTVFVRCEGEEDIIDVNPVTWENMKYSLNDDTSEINEEIMGTFEQIPLKPAWAITIHKSQGLTFEKAIIDARAAFAHGQVYVALSRCKSLEGMVLNRPLDPSCFIHNNQVTGFIEKVEGNQPNEEKLRSARKTFEESLLKELFDFNELSHSLNSLVRELKVHSSGLSGNMASFIEEKNRAFEKDILAISIKFLPRIRELLSESEEITENLRLQEKISGASNYFIDKINEILLPDLTNMRFETDNKEVRKNLDKKLDRVREILSVKNKCMEVCRNGFELASYLDVRAKAQLEELPSQKSSGKIEAANLNDIRNPDLYSKLLRWRNRVTEEKQIAHYMVMQLKPLITLSNYAPGSLEEMATIKGIGKRKLEEFGEELLEIIKGSGAENTLKEEELQNRIRKKKKKKENKVPSAEVSYTMYKSGKNIQEIVEERGYSLRTIESHLAEMVGEGKLDINDFVSEEKVNAILDYFKNSGNYLLREAKEALGEDYSYSELKYVQKHLQGMSDNEIR